MRLCYIHTYMGHRRACGIGSQYFISHKHEMNEDTEKREVDESIISLQKKKKKKKKKVCKVPTWKRNLNMSSSS